MGYREIACKILYLLAQAYLEHVATNLRNPHKQRNSLRNICELHKWLLPLQNHRFVLSESVYEKYKDILSD